jgi:hypothetical protein
MVAPMVLDGPINGDAFTAYVRHILVPELRRGDVVVMDNLSSHKGKHIREMIEAAGATHRRACVLRSSVQPWRVDWRKLDAGQDCGGRCCGALSLGAISIDENRKDFARVAWEQNSSI